MKKDKIIYWTATSLISVMTLFGGGMYLFNHAMVSEMFAQLGYPVYLVYPLGVAKVLAIIAILSKKAKLLKELAYAGLFFTFILGALAHIQAEVDSFVPALVALILLVISYAYDKKLSVKH